MENKTKFLKIYANLPQPVRTEVVAVVDDEPYTWQAAKLEIEQNTEIGKKILDFLQGINVLK